MILVQQQAEIPMPELINIDYNYKFEKGWLWMSITPGRVLNGV